MRSVLRDSANRYGLFPCVVVRTRQLPTLQVLPRNFVVVCASSVTAPAATGVSMARMPSLIRSDARSSGQCGNLPVVMCTVLFGGVTVERPHEQLVDVPPIRRLNTAADRDLCRPPAAEAQSPHRWPHPVTGSRSGGPGRGLSGVRITAGLWMVQWGTVRSSDSSNRLR